jgi:hypothetical protein
MKNYDVYHVTDMKGNYLYNVATNNGYLLCQWKTQNNYHTEFFDRFSIDIEQDIEMEIMKDVFIIKPTK